MWLLNCIQSIAWRLLNMLSNMLRNRVILPMTSSLVWVRNPDSWRGHAVGNPFRHVCSFRRWMIVAWIVDIISSLCNSEADKYDVFLGDKYDVLASMDAGTGGAGESGKELTSRVDNVAVLEGGVDNSRSEGHSELDDDELSPSASSNTSSGSQFAS